jgi:hypothetical protein
MTETDTGDLLDDDDDYIDDYDDDGLESYWNER